MAKQASSSNTPPEAVISIIGVGMTMVGDSDTSGSLRIEGTVRGNVRAGKSVVVGRGGLVDGSVFTQDAVIAGRVSGGIHAESRLELQATSEVSGEIVAPRMQVEEGAKVQGQVAIGESAPKPDSKAAKPSKVGGGGKDGPETRSEVESETEPETGPKTGSETEPKTGSEIAGDGKGERKTAPEQIRGGVGVGSETTPRDADGGGKGGPNLESKESTEAPQKQSHG